MISLFCCEITLHDIPKPWFCRSAKAIFKNVIQKQKFLHVYTCFYMLKVNWRAKVKCKLFSLFCDFNPQKNFACLVEKLPFQVQSLDCLAGLVCQQIPLEINIFSTLQIYIQKHWVPVLGIQKSDWDGICLVVFFGVFLPQSIN